jgi:hypothetical protein
VPVVREHLPTAESVPFRPHVENKQRNCHGKRTITECFEARFGHGGLFSRAINDRPSQARAPIGLERGRATPSGDTVLHLARIYGQGCGPGLSGSLPTSSMTRITRAVQPVW